MSRLRFIVLSVVMSVFAVSAQNATPIFEGFEDAQAVNRWTFVQPTSKHKWYIGKATSLMDSTCLYVSADGGKTLGYTNSNMGIAAYATYTVDKGFYDVSFDYTLVGETDSKGVGVDSLFVYWVTNPSERIIETKGDRPKSLEVYRQNVNSTAKLKGENLWDHCSFRVRVRADNTQVRLVFYWVTNSSVIVPPGVAIDNVQITTDDEPCAVPQNFDVTHENGAKLSWDKTSASHYQVVCKNNTTGQQMTIDSIYDTPYYVEGLTKGMYTFWLRGICGTDTSGWASYTSHIVAVSTDKCINFIDIYNTDVVECRYGRYGESATANLGVNDHGPASEKSQHTIHYKQGERDVMVPDLTTIPKGEIASVRLGNWFGGSEAESMKYKLTVNAANPILIIKYAAVMRNIGHNGEDRNQPRFIIRVTDQRGRPLDEKCLSIEYLTGSPTLPVGWNRIPLGQLSDGSMAYTEWKDWTTMGLNLSAYIGRTVYVYLETGDCSPVPGEGCPGYAYFTLDCVSDKFSGLTCGAAAEKIDTIWAPSGFRYSWAKKRDPYTVLKTDRFFVPTPGDTTAYICTMNFMDPGREACAFTLEASLLPRYPAANASFTVCQQTVSFVDSSNVFTINGVTSEQPDVFWDFGDGAGYSEEHNPVYTYSEPGRYEVVLRASIDDGMCDSIWSAFVEVTSDTLKTVDTVYICKGDMFLFGENYLSVPGVYSDTLFNKYGCDSISVIDLRIHDTYADSVICGGEPFVFEGETYNFESGIYELVYKNIKSYHGCDTILRLSVSDEISVSPEEPVCADDESVRFTLNAGLSDSVRVTVEGGPFVPVTLPIEDNAFVLPMPDGVKAGIYKIHMLCYNEYCGSTERTMELVIHYPTSIMVQRWNDVIALRNKEHNGGYDFAGAGFQWYVDGEPAAGQTHSIYYTENGRLDVGKQYSVLITDASGVSIMSCPFEAVQVDLDDDDIGVDVVNSRTDGATAHVYAANTSGEYRIYDSMGRLYSSGRIEQGDNLIHMLYPQGMYVLQIIYPDGRTESHKIAIR